MQKMRIFDIEAYGIDKITDSLHVLKQTGVHTFPPPFTFRSTSFPLIFFRVPLSLPDCVTPCSSYHMKLLRIQLSH